MSQYTNDLIHESSPYLQQHAHNPVDWLAWGPKAFRKAQTENKPIFLSIGYSSCHWCHVMEKETFMDEDVAEFINEYFVSVKVDREERPDVDHIYMTALQSMTDHAGWPLNMFLSPNGDPFYGGTYFPKIDRQGMPSFLKVAKTIARTWESDEENVVSQSKHLTQHIKTELNRTLPAQTLVPDLLARAFDKVDSHLDHVYGGFYSSAPKFPHAFFLDLYTERLFDKSTPDQEKVSLNLSFSLRKMAEGGIYDHVAGGFHRYSTDRQWLVPHFEKMLYDNAILAKTYFEAAKVVDKDFNITIGKEICDYILREMTHPEGAFYSSTDADSEDVEGLFFIWSRNELKQILGDEDADLFADIFNITKDEYEQFDKTNGTPPHEWFQGHITHLNNRLETVLVEEQVSREHLAAMKEKLYNYRQQKRIGPFRDEKILSSWNGLMVQGMTAAYEMTGEEKYFEAAQKCLDFLSKNLLAADKSLYVSWKDAKAQHMGTLEDYANFIAALIAFHRIGGANHYLLLAKDLCEKALALFWEKEEGSFYYTTIEQDLIIRPKHFFDHAVPSAHGMMAKNLFYLGRLFAEEAYTKILDQIFLNLSGFLLSMPHATASLVRAYHHSQAEAKDYVLIGASSAMRLHLLQKLKPQDILLTEEDKDLELVRDKLSSPKPALFICYKKTCGSPIIGEENLERFLGQGHE